MGRGRPEAVKGGGSVIMTAESQDTLVGPLLAQLSGRLSAAELDQVRDAYEFAARCMRGNGERALHAAATMTINGSIRPLRKDRAALVCRARGIYDDLPTP